jgi:hypothetical protein
MEWESSLVVNVNPPMMNERKRIRSNGASITQNKNKKVVFQKREGCDRFFDVVMGFRLDS